MINWNKYPFVRLLFPFAFGVWMCMFFTSFRLHFFTLYVIAIGLVVIMSVVSRRLKNYEKAWVFGAVLSVCLFALGYAIALVNDEQEKKTCFRNADDAMAYIARLYDSPEEREKNYKVVLDVEGVVVDSLHTIPASGKIMAYIGKDGKASSLRYGDMICFAKTVAEVQYPRNPGEFDYHGYLFRKGVIGQVFLADNDWKSLGENRSNPIYGFSYRFRDRLLASLRNCGIDGEEFGVAAAILLGYDDDLSPELRQSYVTAGSMHILCVSGMHVGIIFLMASFMLGFLNRKKWLKILKNVILLLLIWFYALLAGLSPSIMRASIMISLCIIGEMINRKGFTINSIAASAFLLLCLNPGNLFEIGFLLSYSAVVGIVTLQKPIYDLVYFKNKHIDKLWEITAVALAAQIATCPFTIFYFNQFTTYFLLSNIFMTPISFIVVLSGMLLILVSWIPYLNTLVGYVVWGTLYLMNNIVVWIETLPFSIVRGLYISQWELLLLLVAVVALMLFVNVRTKRNFYVMFVTVSLFVCSFSLRHFITMQANELHFYSFRNHTAVDFVCHGSHVMIADTSFAADKQAVDYSLASNWYKLSLDTEPLIVGLDDDHDNGFVRKRGNLIQFGDKIVALAKPSMFANSPVDSRIKVDYLLFCGKNKMGLANYANLYEIGHLVIDGTVPRYLADELKIQAGQMGISCSDLGEHALMCRID